MEQPKQSNIEIAYNIAQGLYTAMQTAGVNVDPASPIAKLRSVLHEQLAVEARGEVDSAIKKMTGSVQSMFDSDKTPPTQTPCFQVIGVQLIQDGQINGTCLFVNNFKAKYYVAEMVRVHKAAELVGKEFTTRTQAYPVF